MPEAILPIGLNSRLAVNPDLVLRIEDDDCALLYDPVNGRVQMINGTAVDVWRQLDGKRSVREVIEALKALYDGIDAEASQQVLSLIENLASCGAVGVWEQD